MTQSPNHPWEFDPDTGERVRPPSGDAAPPAEIDLPDDILGKPASDILDCKQCGGTMIKTKRARHNLGAQLLGVVGFGLGVLLLVFFWPAGLVLIGASLFAGYQKVRGWHCQGCGYFFEVLR